MSIEAEYTPDQLMTPEVIDNPYPAYSQLRAGSPCYYPYLPAGITPSLDKPVMAWALMRHEDVYRAIRDHETFSSATSPLVELGLSPRLSLLFDDPPRHSRLRKLISSAFTMRRIEELESWMTEIASKLLADLPAGEAEIMENLAIPLPMLVIARLLGIPQSEYRQFRKWSEAFVSTIKMPYEERRQMVAEMSGFFAKVIAERRQMAGGDDLISALTAAEVDGEALTDAEVLGLCVVLLIAGNETTVNLIGAMLNILAGRPELYLALQKDRSLINAFIDETLRYESPVQRMPRTATRDVEINGKLIRKGEPVIIFYGAANRDPEAFENPDEFRMDRDNRSSVAFGAGIHYCMGAPLARTEARIMLNAVLDIYAGLQPGIRPSIRQSGSGTVLGFTELYINLERA